MFSHLIIGARDLPLLGRFYDGVLGEMGWSRQPVDDDGGPDGLMWRPAGRSLPEFWVQKPWNGLPATWGNGTQVSFLATSPEEVDRAHAAALRLGGADEGAPGPRPHYGPDYYGAYCRDPEGNKLCFAFGIS